MGQLPLSNQNWRAFPIDSYLRALFFPAGNVFAISLQQTLERLIAIHTCEFYLNFLRFDDFEGQKANEHSLLHMAILRVGLSKMKRHIMALRTHRYP
jgi:hypothetical protein